MIERYTRKEMGDLWRQEVRFEKMLEVETAVAETQAQLGIIPKKAAQEIRQHSRFQVEQILEIERVTKHDVIAFVSNVASYVGESGKFLHYGMTSSDVLDTALSLQILEAGRLLQAGVQSLKESLGQLVRKHKNTLCAGRTHGMFAEPLTFGLKMSGFYSELCRNEERLERALEQIRICKMSGAVGTYSGQPPEVEAGVAKRLGLKIETIATQVIPRDRHCEVLFSLSMIMSGLERLSIELRHLQRSDVNEVEEGFSKGQKGSSAMPHKKNPISAENITGLSRLVRGYFQSSQENIPLWHERDISHSSVERVIFPDAFIVTDYALHRMSQLISGLVVKENQMMANLEKSQGQIFSSLLLLEMVQKGLSREEAYAHVQRLCHQLKEGEHLREAILKDSVVSKYFNAKILDEIFEGRRNRKNIELLISRALGTSQKTPPKKAQKKSSATKATLRKQNKKTSQERGLRP